MTFDNIPTHLTSRVWEGKISVVRRVVACLVVASAFASLLLAAAPFSAGQGEINVISDFSPALDTYDQGQNFSILLTITNAGYYNPDFTSQVMVTNISSYFSWLPPNTWLRKDLTWSMAPDRLND